MRRHRLHVGLRRADIKAPAIHQGGQEPVPLPQFPERRSELEFALLAQIARLLQFRSARVASHFHRLSLRFCGRTFALSLLLQKLVAFPLPIGLPLFQRHVLRFLVDAQGGFPLHFHAVKRLRFHIRSPLRDCGFRFPRILPQH